MMGYGSSHSAQTLPPQLSPSNLLLHTIPTPIESWKHQHQRQPANPTTHQPEPSSIQCTSYTVLGKAEGSGHEWHGHVTALTVAPEYRRLGLARKMMNLLEFVSDEIYKGFFVDLYVRCANTLAIEMYEKMGYSVYRRVKEYYGNLGMGKGGRDEEDAFDMRKPLSRDSTRRSIRPNGREVIVGAHEVP
ncbi:hypothetical protein AX16_007040 [Volvariella volvacea WC 439]|nr:hypothetical protein AX16_007040 [Volvariella volvacea WC 439]